MGRLDELDVLGFDYDYTLASYTDKVPHFIYERALEHLIKVHGYPQELRSKSFDPSFAIRGLHYDTKKGYMMKLDYLNLIQADTVHFGRTQLSEDRLYSAYPSLFISRQYMAENMRLLIDLFGQPEACLLSDIIQHLSERQAEFDPAYVYEDVSRAIQHVHSTRLLHTEIMAHLDVYLKANPALGETLWRVKQAGKQLFLATNSPFDFVNAGMQFLLQGHLPNGVKHWTDMFDLVMASCHKPSFFLHNRPFRVYDPEMDRVTWDRPHLKNYQGQILLEGSLKRLIALTGWTGDRVIYFGDHIFHDLKEPSSVAGWKTGVIIRELEKEVEIQNSSAYRSVLAELLEVERLMKKCMLIAGDRSHEVIFTLRQHRMLLRTELKGSMNPTFGSAFRTHKHASHFAYLLQRYCQVYTSKLENFLSYPTHYVFYPERTFLPHEVQIPPASLWKAIRPI
jgi:HAD superfamily 5'-nucleotidase-like hydrolase